MKLVLSGRADLDIVLILRETLRLFGPRQVDVYSDLITAALDLIAEDPVRPSSVDRSDLAAGVRSLHVSLAASRRSAASHVAFYLWQADAGAETPIHVIRVLHQSMEPAVHVSEGLRDLTGRR